MELLKKKKYKNKKKRLDYLSYSLDQKESEKTSGLFFFFSSDPFPIFLSLKLQNVSVWVEGKGRRRDGRLRCGTRGLEASFSLPVSSSTSTTTRVYFAEPPAGWENLGTQTSET